MMRILVLVTLVACGSPSPPPLEPRASSPPVEPSSSVPPPPPPTCFRTHDDATCFASADAVCDRLSPGFRAHCRCGTPAAGTVLCHRDW